MRFKFQKYKRHTFYFSTIKLNHITYLKSWIAYLSKNLSSQSREIMKIYILYFNSESMFNFTDIKAIKYDIKMTSRRSDLVSNIIRPLSLAKSLLKDRKTFYCGCGNRGVNGIWDLNLGFSTWDMFWLSKKIPKIPKA